MKLLNWIKKFFEPAKIPSDWRIGDWIRTGADVVGSNCGFVIESMHPDGIRMTGKYFNWKGKSNVIKIYRYSRFQENLSIKNLATQRELETFQEESKLYSEELKKLQEKHQLR